MIVETLIEEAMRIAEEMGEPMDDESAGAPSVTGELTRSAASGPPMSSARLDAFVPPPPSGRRAEVLAELAAAVVALPSGRRTVALDGVDGAGKTVLGSSS